MNTKLEKELTIIMPTFNDKLAKIKRSLDSIDYQKNYEKGKIEIIISDDNSTNNVNWNEILKDYHNLNIKYIKLEENMGPGIARQTALDEANGKYVFFLDCGDTLYDANVLSQFNNCTSVDTDVIYTKIYDTDTGCKRRSFLVNNSYIFGIFIKNQFLKDNNIRFNNILRWEEDTYFEQILRYYNPTMESAKIIGYTYLHDDDSITRIDNHAYQNNYYGFSAMIVNSILLCNFYKDKEDYNHLYQEILRALILCYSRFYNDLFKVKNISERQLKILHLLKILIDSFNFNITSEKTFGDFVRLMLKKNFMYKMEGQEQISCDKYFEFSSNIINSTNNNGNYDIEGTNITINELIELQNIKINIFNHSRK